MDFDPHTARDLQSATRRMRRLARAVLGNEHDAEDAAQDAWIRALGGTAASRAGEAWLAGVARNAARERRRSERRRGAREAAAARPEHRSPEQVALDQVEALQRLVGVVRSLEEPHRSALVLCYVVGLTPADAAEALGVNRATLRSRVHRGLSLVRARLDRQARKNRGTWRAAITPIVTGGIAPAAGGMAMSKSTSIVGVAVVLLCFAAGAHLLLSESDRGDVPASSPKDAVWIARESAPQLEGLGTSQPPTPPPGPAAPKAERVAGSPAASRPRFGLRVLIQPAKAPIEYDHGASWVYAVPQADGKSGNAGESDGVRAPWLAGQQAVDLALPSAGPWLVGVNTDQGVAIEEGVEVAEGKMTEVALELPDPEASRQDSIAVIVEHDGLPDPDAIEPVVRIEPRRLAGRTYSHHPRRGELPLPRPRNIPVAWGLPTAIACYRPAVTFALSVALRSDTAGATALLLVAPRSLDAEPGQRIHFLVQRAGTVLIQVERGDEGDESLGLPDFRLVPALDREVRTARTNKQQNGSSCSFLATPGTWDLSWSGRGWQSGSTRGVVVRPGTVQVLQVMLVRTDEPIDRVAVKPAPWVEPARAERLRSKYPVHVFGTGAFERGDAAFSVLAQARDAEGRSHPVQCEWVELEEDGGALPLEQLTSISGLDSEWRHLESIVAVRLPWHVARCDHAVAPERREDLTFVRGGFLLAVPSRYPKGTTLRLRASDGGMLTSVHSERWREQEPEGLDQAGRSIGIAPGTMIGPLPAGEYEFIVLLGGVKVATVRGRVAADRITPLVVDLGRAQR